MKRKSFYKAKLVLNSKGFSLLELIIAIAIMAILVSFLIPQYSSWVKRGQKATDLDNAETIGRAINVAMINNPEAHAIYNDWKGAEMSVTATVNGVSETYRVYLVMSSETKGFFSGGEGKFKSPMSDGRSFYDVVNEEIGIRYEKFGNTGSARYVNDIMIPRYKVTGLDRMTKVDRWRIVKRKNNGAVEVWSAYDRGQGSGDKGGRPCYRVWPNPDDKYTK